MRQKHLFAKRWGSLRINLTALLLTAIAGLAIYGYYALSPSYNASREAKALYDRGEYQEALVLAQKIQAEHPYNIMAFSVVEQSIKALKYQKFINDAKIFWERIETISQQKTHSKADMLTIRMMAEAVIYDYAKLDDPGILLDKRLVKEADEHNRQFTALYQELFGRFDPAVSGLSGPSQGPGR